MGSRLPDRGRKGCHEQTGTISCTLFHHQLYYLRMALLKAVRIVVPSLLNTPPRLQHFCLFPAEVPEKPLPTPPGIPVALQ